MGMGRKSREKGKRGERELVHELQRFGFTETRRSQQYCGSAESADLVGLPGVHIECKRMESFSPYKALEQAAGDSAGTSNLPAVMHRRNGQPWIVVMTLNDWAKLYQAYLDNSLAF